MWCVRNDHHDWLASTSAPGSGNSQRSADAPIVAQLITDTLGSAQDQHQSVLHFVKHQQIAYGVEVVRMSIPNQIPLYCTAKWSQVLSLQASSWCKLLCADETAGRAAKILSSLIS